eukprot:SAG31_NODE_245_length_19224_cov_10.210614_11_plen_167_part_00
MHETTPEAGTYYFGFWVYDVGGSTSQVCACSRTLPAPPPPAFFFLVATLPVACAVRGFLSLSNACVCVCDYGSQQPESFGHRFRAGETPSIEQPCGRQTIRTSIRLHRRKSVTGLKTNTFNQLYKACRVHRKLGVTHCFYVANTVPAMAHIDWCAHRDGWDWPGLP